MSFMPAEIRFVSSVPLKAGKVGDFVLEITVGSDPIEPGGGFLVYPPITTVPHLWSMVRWEIGGCMLDLPNGHKADAWLVRPSRFLYAESCAVLVRVVNGPDAMPAGYRFRLILSDSRIQTFAMARTWFAMQVDRSGIGPEAYSAPVGGIPFETESWDCRFDYEKNRGGLLHLDVMPAEAERLVAVLEARPRSDGRVYLAVRAEDRFGNPAYLPDRELKLKPSDTSFETPGKISVTPGAVFTQRIDNCRITRPGTYNVQVSAPQSGLCAVSSYTSTELPLPVYFGDIHGHTSLSDGLGRGEDYFQHARNVSFCDILSLTDHNRFDNIIIGLTEKYNEPGRMVTIFGRERGDAHGHRNFYSLSADVVRDCAEGDLWECAGRNAGNVLMVPHHTNAATKRHWKHADFDRYDPECERLMEIVQNRGSFECDEVGGACFDGGYGASARDALRMGRRFGFVGGSDTHRGQPGGPSHPLNPYFHRWRPFNGLTAACMPELTRESLWQSLWNRRTYATTGARILVDFTVNGNPMGSRIPKCSKAHVEAFAAGTAEIAALDIVCNGRVRHTLQDIGNRIARLSWVDNVPGGYYYLRVRQKDDHQAYASPVWIG